MMIITIIITIVIMMILLIIMMLDFVVHRIRSSMQQVNRKSLGLDGYSGLNANSEPLAPGQLNLQKQL